MDDHRWRRLAEVTFANDPVEMARLGVSLAQKAVEGAHRADDETYQGMVAAISGADTTEQREIIEQVLGPALESTPGLMWFLENPLSRGGLLDGFDPELVVEWVEQDPEARLRLIAYAIPVEGQPLTGLARAILIRFGDREEVRSALGATFETGGWIGSEADWIEAKLRQLDGWSEDPHPNVRRWALELAEDYRRRLVRSRLFEEED